MLPEVFECPDCERQFVLDSVPGFEGAIHCPQCRRYLGEKDLHYILRSEIEEIGDRLRFEIERLERDEALYSDADVDPELVAYGRRVHRVIAVLRRALRDLGTVRRSLES